MSASITILLVDDHPPIRAGVAAMLGLYPEFQVVAQAEDGEQALRLHAELKPDLTLMDVRLPGMGGIRAAAAIRAASPKARIIMLSADSLPADISHAREAGACGFLVKTCPHPIFASELRHAHQHGWCQPYDPALPRKAFQTVPQLTAREMEVLHCLRRGLSNTDIGTALGVSVQTAISHVKTLMNKLHAANRTEVVTISYELGLIKVEGTH